MSNDRGLAAMRAVARVRDLREKESRRALQHAMADQRAHAERVAYLQRYLAESSAPALADGSAFTAHRAFLLDTGRSLTEAKQHEQVAASRSSQALTAWQADKTRVNAVEMLIERRLEEARRERQRKETTELDELASSRWSRQQAAAGAHHARGDVVA